jgi:hypothetical protein
MSQESIKFNIGSNKTEKDSKVDSAINPTVAESMKLKEEQLEEELDNEYVDNRKVTISLVENFSLYRKINNKVLDRRKEVIGSSVESSRILASNSGEISKYFPELIGISNNNPEFVSRVKSWLNNIHFVVNDRNVELNTTFIYDHKRDYLDIKKQEDIINNTYDSIDRSNLEKIKIALKDKITKLNALESSKYKYGRPQNVTEYLIYRHCLLYNQVAKDIALINSDARIRFYIKDEAKEQERQNKLIKERNVAMRNYVELISNDSKFDAVYVLISIQRNDNLTYALLKDTTAKQSIVMNFVNDHPDKFNKLIKNEHIMLQAMIEKLIVRGELVRSEYNQQLSTADGTFIGANVKEAIVWFENPNNKAERIRLENSLKN